MTAVNLPLVPPMTDRGRSTAHVPITETFAP
ncbi:hypothetical protein J2X98_004509 [Pseudarthrobacter enclensis]|uniref:Uncharacterized protein n=1 Tax=Pseudarthrobacter enclensis TaxID=993070 RepID=A0ABT9S1K2_9MICC|nr:hypothetical protein [Pseudarthrobacter enclensis]